ncbi:MAG: DUF2066 domain-containing protein [Kiloniellales bacterium]|nr:DUF2066 domain-containing protein [Kiloniellales bacterium]
MQIRRALASIVLTTVLALPAAAEDIFTVNNIRVDATAGNAAEARKAALASGHLQAMQRLLSRLVLRDDLGLLPPLSADQVVDLVHNFGVDDERTSSVRYLARLTFQFNPAAVRDYLRARGVRFADARGRPALLLPVFGAANQAVLWEDPNPWRNAWASRDNRGGLVPLLVPLGDLADISSATSRDALNPDNPRLQPLAERYGAKEVVTTQAVLAGDPAAGGASLQIITARSGAARQERTRVLTLQQNQDESFQQLLMRAAETVAVEINEAWKRSSRLRFESEGELLVQVPIGDLKAWLEVKRRLEKVPAVEKVTLVYLNTESAQLRLSYFGDVNQLSQSLAQNDLQLTNGEDGAPQLVLAP